MTKWTSGVSPGGGSPIVIGSARDVRPVVSLTSTMTDRDRSTLGRIGIWRWEGESTPRPAKWGATAYASRRSSAQAADLELHPDLADGMPRPPGGNRSESERPLGSGLPRSASSPRTPGPDVSCDLAGHLRGLVPVRR